MRADALALPFEDGAFDRLFTEPLLRAPRRGRRGGSCRGAARRGGARRRRLGRGGAGSVRAWTAALGAERYSLEATARSWRRCCERCRSTRRERTRSASSGGGERAPRRARWFVVVRPRTALTRPRARRTARSPRSSATTAAAAPASRPATRSSRCRSLEGRPASARTSSARRPGSSRARSAGPWRGRAGQTLRRWLEIDEDEFYATFYCAVGHALLPGPRAVRPRRPHADAARAGALRVLARLGAASCSGRG